ncbi:hypothetical protein [Rhodopirellula halodulae]|uniref:hypothetical protein n=1 Tax=Rhodopirellula halodulae TaxID=2894198 RepID=UPI001E5900DA|nr:hypothetical protein [Rhodopirellula sp. JC737]MCC9656730.1 hypothetical protein [Rhodopirellula sp. JC737]
MRPLAAVRYRLKTLILLVTLVAFTLAAYSYWDAIPGTYHKNKDGFPRGTGVAEYHYDDGSLMIREWYFRGLIYRSTWFTPDGRELATETYDKATGGVGYYLRQDGTIRSKYTYEYMPDVNMYGNAGKPVYYDASGTPVPDATEPID